MLGAPSSTSPPATPVARLLPVAAGLLVVLGVTAYDVASGASKIVIGSAVLGVFLTAVLGTPRDTALVAVVAVLCTAASGAWNHNFPDEDYVFRLIGVLAGCAIAIVAAVGRARSALGAQRFAILSAIGEIADGSRTLAETTTRLADVLVPAIADQCIFDTISPRAGLSRLSVRVHGPDAAAQERFLRERPLTRPGAGVGSRSVLAGDHAMIVQYDDAARRAAASDDEDLARLRELDLRSVTVVPLHARGRTLGALTLGVSGSSGRTYREDDLRFHEVLAGRAALALDNAGLDRELRDAERQLGVALGSLDEAVTVMDAAGRTMYANDAAVALLGFDDATDLYAARPGELMELFDVYDESGARLRIEDMPSSRVVATGADAEPMLVRNVVRATGEERWLRQRVTPISDEEGRLMRLVNVIEDVTELKLAELRSRLLAEASAVLASSLDYERTLQRVTEIAVPGLADWCGVALPDDRGMIRTVAVAHADPAKVAFARELAERYPERPDARVGVATVIRDGRPVCVNEIPDALLAGAARDEHHLELLRTLGIRAGLVVPMLAGGHVVGALSLISAESGRTFSAADIELAEELARRAGTAVENARLFTERSRITAALQESLLPPDLPAIPGWGAAALYSPAGELNEVGGDFYDVFDTPGGWMLVVGDVTGHGAHAAKLTAVSRFALRSVAELTGDPVLAIRQLNRMLLNEQELSLLTLALMRLEPRSAAPAALDVVLCGHPAPLLLAADGAVTPVGATGPLVGAFADSAWKPARLTMDAGDTLLVYTDGITDATDGERRFGVDRLSAALASGPGTPAELVARVARAVRAFRAGAQRDDEAILALRAEPVPVRDTASGPLQPADGARRVAPTHDGG